MWLASSAAAVPVATGPPQVASRQQLLHTASYSSVGLWGLLSMHSYMLCAVDGRVGA